MDTKGKESDEILFHEIHKFGRSSIAVIVILSGLGVFWLYGYLVQLRHGLVVTGLNVPAYWAIYLANFVYFIGLSHAGTLISAILRVTYAEWRRPVTRLAEAITVFVLLFGIANIGLDLGRPDRGPINIFKFGRFQSPLLWDFASIFTYLVLSSLFLYVATIPDLAHLRDRVKRGKRFYEILALNFRGTEKQWHQYERSVLVLSVIVIPVAVSVHTVISFIFSMTLQPMWHETMFGPYFVAGAIFSGVAAICVAMYLIRRFYHMEEYLTPRVFNNMGKILLAMSLIWFYFFLAENLTTWYGNEAATMTVLRERALGRYQIPWILLILTNIVIPFILLTLRRTVRGVTIAGASVCIGMYLERFLIVVPTMLNPRLPLVEPRSYGLPSYIPTWIEFGSIIGSFAIFALLYYLFTKVVPIVPFSEVREEEKRALEMHDGGLEEAHHQPSGRQSDNVRKIQYGLIAGFLLFELVIVGFMLNGIRNGLIFGIFNKEILDMGSLVFSLGVNFFFLPVHLVMMYTMTKLGLVLIREGDATTI
ncbi:MAG: NrfD/PsrC family molybdoenzyme membrane anchor subunit [Candidatus Hydrothermarchaeaceae archaeon]